MRIVSLEDDEPFWDLMKEALEDAFSSVQLTWVRTESEFCEKMNDFVATPPDVFVLDVMVKWADPAEPMPPAPEEVIRESYYRAGLRCRNRLRKFRETATIPVILFTVLEATDIVATELPPDTPVVGKKGDFRELINGIARNLSARSPTGRR